MHFRKYFFSYIVLVLFILLVAASYNRFIINKDYLVAYEGECDPYTESCFVWCENFDDCPEPFYFTIIERHASEIYNLCGQDVTTCDDAYYCDESVEYCEVYYCEPEFDGEDSCESLTENDYQRELKEF